jgi:hypothetical protein
MPDSPDSSHADHSSEKLVPIFPSKSDVSLTAAAADYDTLTGGSNSKKSKQNPFTILHRTRSIKDSDKDNPSPNSKEFAPAPVKVAEPERAQNSTPLKTAPVHLDRSFREMMSSTIRNQSAERYQQRDAPGCRERQNDSNTKILSSSLKEDKGSAFLSGLKNSSSKISKGLFGKNTRSTNEREPVDDEHYVLKVINLPLVEQTRRTRISKRLEDSRDKTEFWMPAFPWRAIDYLNYNGSDVEGLYRVPGSGAQIKRWQRKFDEGQYFFRMYLAVCRLADIPRRGRR